MIFLDTETELIRQGVLAPRLVCLQVARGDESPWLAVAGIDPVEEIVRELLDAGQVVVGHNVAYDMLVLATEYPDLWPAILDAYEADGVTDTMLRAQLVAIAAGTHKREKYSLEALAWKVGVKKDGDDPWRSKYSLLRGVPFERWPAAARRYALHDIEATRAVYLRQRPPSVHAPTQEVIPPAVTEGLPVSPDEFRQARAALVLHVIGATGVRTDPAAIGRLEAGVQRELGELREILQREGLISRGGTRSTASARERMTDVMGAAAPRTKTGLIALDEESCQKSGDPILESFAKYGSLQSFRSRIQRLRKGVEIPLTPRFRPLKQSGRTGCAAGAHGYQIQNMRRAEGERECFIPRRPGSVFLAVDYDGAELHSLAQMCVWTVGYSRLADALNRGLDPHLLMAARALGRDYEELTEILAHHDHPEHAAIKLARQGSKIANFGYPGGMGAQSFVAYAAGYGMELTVSDAEKLKADWLKAWPEMPEYFAWIRDAHRWHATRARTADRELTTIRHPMSGRVRGEVFYTAACNSYFQGLAADAAKDAGWHLLRATRGGDLQGWLLWNFVHDEYLLEGPVEDGDRAAKVVQRIMIEAATRWMPDLHHSAEATLMRRWSKSAEPTFDAAGRLVPWDAR